MKTDEEKLKKLEELMTAIAWQVVRASKGQQVAHDSAKADRQRIRAEFLKMIEEEAWKFLSGK